MSDLVLLLCRRLPSHVEVSLDLPITTPESIVALGGQALVGAAIEAAANRVASRNELRSIV